MGVLQFVDLYRKSGRICLPIPAGSKATDARGWSDERPPDVAFLDGGGVAWRLDGVTDIDLDSREAAAMARALLPRTQCMSGREGAGVSHLFYEGMTTYKKYEGPRGTILEIRSGRTHYTVVPPSPLPESKGRPAAPAVWYADGPPTAVEQPTLLRAADLLAVGALLAEGLGRHGLGHAARLDVAGLLLRLGVTVEETTDVLEAMSIPCENTETADCAIVAKSTAAKLREKGATVTGGPALAERIGPAGPQYIVLVEKWLGKPKAAKTAQSLGEWTELTDAEHFARENAGRLRYDYRRGRWLIFREEAHLWRPEGAGEAHALTHDAIRSLQRIALEEPDSDLRKAKIKHALGGEGHQRLLNVERRARSLAPLADDGSNWDRDPWLLGCPNGVLDLRTGLMRAGTPDDRITMSVTPNYNPEAKCPLWDKTIQEIFKGDEEVIGYVDRFLGYSLTGDCREEALLVCWGDGANGKGTLMNTFSRVLGDYADDLPFSAFELQSRSGIPNDIAKIAGKRFVTSSETGEGIRLNEARIKALTGRDPITARFLHKEFFTFQPEAKFALATNHMPEITDDSPGFWRRMHLLAFLASFVGREDKTLKDRLLAEAEGILARAVRGCLEWQAVGLLPPESVKASAAEWRRESDALAPFMESECVVVEGARVQANALYAAYAQWAKRIGVRDPLSQRAVGLRMRKLFRVEEARHVHYLGIGLRDDSRGDDPGM